MSLTQQTLKLALPLAISLVLAACGGGGSSDKSSSTVGFGSNDTSSTDATDTDTTTTTVGSAEDLVYSLEPLEVGLTELSAGGSTGLTTRLVDQNGDFASEPFSITFNSPCASNGASEIVSPVTSSNGVFASTYTAKGCEGDDKITASVNGITVETTVNVKGANLGAVEFIGAEPQNILLKGMSAPGRQHTSTVTFQIKNDVGGPIANADVKFELTSEVGGITLSSVVGKTDNNGFVSTILQAGTVHTSVRVRATVERDNDTISSESSQLIISTGIADQNSLSLSLSVHNPSAWNYDGEKVSVNMYASDRYNNPVPDGTSIAFFTELGQIEPSCQTTNGACVVEWTSSDPRDLGIINPLYPRNSTTANSDGITTITAVVIGEESFIDTNSNGIFDDGDILDSISDRGEAFEDYNMNYDTDTVKDHVSDNDHDDGLEPYLDFNLNGMRDPKDDKYTGLGCAHSTLCGNDNGLKHIFTSIELVMAETSQSIRIWEGGIGGNLVNTISNGVSYTIEVFGVTNNQVPPAGTTIVVASDEAEVVVGNDTVGSTNRHLNNLTSPSGSYGVGLFVKDKDPLVKENGYVKITVTTPKGQAVTHFFNYLDD